MNINNILWPGTNPSKKQPEQQDHREMATSVCTFLHTTHYSDSEESYCNNHHLKNYRKAKQRRISTTDAEFSP